MRRPVGQGAPGVFDELLRRPGRLGGEIDSPERLDRAPRAPSAPPLWGLFGRVLGGVGAILWPSEIGGGDLTPEQRAEAERAFTDELERQRRTQVGPVPPPDMPDELPWPFAPVPLPQLPEPEPPILPPPLPDLEPELPEPVSERDTRPRPPPLSEPWFQFGRLPDVRQRAQRMTNPFPMTNTMPFAQPMPQPSVQPLQPPALTPFEATGVASQPLPQTMTSSWSSGGGDPCGCNSTRPRRKQRKCRQSAPVIWGGGPRKGQIAGNRCFSWESP